MEFTGLTIGFDGKFIAVSKLLYNGGTYCDPKAPFVNKYEYNLVNFICDTNTCSPIELEKNIYYTNTIDTQTCNINECSVMVI